MSETPHASNRPCAPRGATNTGRLGLVDTYGNPGQETAESTNTDSTNPMEHE